MTDTLRHTAPVSLPRTQEPGVASVRSTGEPTVPHASAGTDAPAQHRRVGSAAHPTDTSAIRTAGIRATRDTLTEENPISAVAPGADTLLTATMPGDPLPFFPFDGQYIPAATETPWRNVRAEEVFGTESVPVRVERLHGMQAVSLTENPVFQGFVLLLAVTYAMLLYRNLGDIRLLLTRVSRDRATGERLTEDPGGSGFSRFLNIATTIGMLFMGVMVVKYGDSLMPGRLTDLLSHGAVLVLSLLATLACMGVVLFQLATVRLAGAVTLSQPFISQIVLLKRTYFTLAVIITSPVLLLFALCPRGTGGLWFCIIVIELIVTAILYLREVLNLFISKKISILHWILYLCTVEVFPISLLWLLAVR